MAADDPLACFGSRTVEVHGYLSEMGGVGGCHVQFIPGDGWLDLCAAPLPIVVGNLTDSDGLAFHLAPGLDPDDAARGSIVRLVGHFDDPAAQSCGVEGGTAADTAAARESCRRAFVVEEITSIR